VPRQLSADIAVFAGRSAELTSLDALLPADGDPPAPVVVISGGAGVGKTTLAVHWAHRVQQRFPDGQLYVNLRGFAPAGNETAPDEVARGFLGALNLPAAQIPVNADAVFSLYRSLLADKRVLIVLDNARDTEQVRPLLPASPGCLTVVTSRDQMSSLVAAEGAVPVVLGQLSANEAREMLTRRLGAARVDGEPAAVAELAELCARLPLALAIVTARAVTNPGFPLSTLVDELRETRGQLDAFDAGDSATSVRTIFSWSYLTLAPAAARLFRLLGLHPGPHLTAPVAASLLGAPVRQARSLLTELTRAHLITELCLRDRARRHRGPGGRAARGGASDARPLPVCRLAGRPVAAPAAEVTGGARPGPGRGDRGGGTHRPPGGGVVRDRVLGTACRDRTGGP
jgi:hypothetical protein